MLHFVYLSKNLTWTIDGYNFNSEAKKVIEHQIKNLIKYFNSSETFYYDFTVINFFHWKKLLKFLKISLNSWKFPAACEKFRINNSIFVRFKLKITTFQHGKNTRIFQSIPKIYRRNLPKYTKINKNNTNIFGIILQYFSIRELNKLALNDVN
jgi:hypothetical protein